MKILKLIVYEMLEDELSPIGIIQDYISLSYSPSFCNVGSFSLTIPFSVENLELVSPNEKIEKAIYIEEGYIGICHKVTCELSPSVSKIQIKGSLGAGYLENCVTGLFSLKPKPITEEYRIREIQIAIQDRMQNDTALKQTLWPGIIFERDSSFQSYILNGLQIGRSTFGKFVRDLCRETDRGYSVKLNDSNKMQLRILRYSDRSVGNTDGNAPVIISRQFMPMSTSKYSLNSQEYKNVVYCWSKFTYNQEENIIDTYVTYDDVSTIANMPKNLIRASYDEVMIEQPEDVTTTEEIATVIVPMIRQNAKQNLYDHAYIKSYECNLSGTESESAFKFGEDYFLGDYVTIYDEKLKIQVKAQLLEYTKSYTTKGEEFEPAFGYSQPTLNQILKQKGVL